MAVLDTVINGDDKWEITMKNVISASTVTLDRLQNRCQELTDILNTCDTTKKEIEGQLNQYFQTIHRRLEARKLSLLVDLQNAMAKRKSNVQILLCELQQRSQKISMNADLMKNYLVFDDPNCDKLLKFHVDSRFHSGQFQDLYNEIKVLLKSIISPYPSSSDILSFFPIDLDKLLSAINGSGAIGITSIDADQTVMDVPYNKLCSDVIKCVANKQVSWYLKAFDCERRELKSISPSEFNVSLNQVNIKNSEVYITEEPSPSSLESTVHEVGHEHRLKVFLQIPTPGIYDLNIRVLGEHIRGSPFRIQNLARPGPGVEQWRSTILEISRLPHRVERQGISKDRRCISFYHLPLSKDTLPAYADNSKWMSEYISFIAGSEGRGSCEFVNPQGIWITRDSKILVVDSNNANLQVFDLRGKLIIQIGEFGIEPGQFIRPIDVAETINNNYLISDFETHSINVFNPLGGYISRFGQRNLTGPKGIAVNSKGKIIVADFKACLVAIFKPTGKFIKSFGNRGLGDHNFTGPSFIAVDSRDYIFVSDPPGHNIQCFDTDGGPLLRFGINGFMAGALHCPSGLCFDDSDMLYVTDSGNDRIQIFNSEGKFLNIFKTELSPLREPVGICVSSKHQLIVVADSKNCKLKAFKAH